MRKTILALSALVLSTTLAGCGFGTAVQNTVSMGGVGNGVDVASGDLLAQDVTIVSTGSSAGISATVINNADAETSITGITVNGQALSLIVDGAASTSVPVVAGGATRIGFQSPVSAVGAYAISAGTYADVVISFADGSILSAKALVVSKDGIYVDVVTDVPAAPVA